MIRNSGIYVTKTAWNKMADIIKSSQNKLGFLFSASSGGCNGFNFDLSLLDDETYDNIYRMKPSIMENNETYLYIDPLTEMYLLGTTIDYISEDYSKNMYESKFIFQVDKKRASSCGCGISFTPNN